MKDMQRGRLGTGAVALVVMAIALPACSQTSVSGPGSAAFRPVSDPAALVDPFVGTGSGGAQVGDINTFPGADVPFGMVQWSPDTPNPMPFQALAGGYAYSEKTIRGFSATHLSGAGCPAAGDFPVMPYPASVTVSPLASPSTYEASFNHSDEQAQPGLYAVKLGDGIGVRLSVTDRSGIGEFSFPAGVTPSMIVNPAGTQTTISAERISIVGDDVIEGSATAPPICGGDANYTIYFAARFEQPFASYGVWQGGTLLPGTRSTVSSLGGAYVSFAPASSAQTVAMKMSVSYVSTAGALANINAEQSGWNFANVAKRAHDTWNALLSRIQVSGGSLAQRKVFYTALYHSLLFPSIFSDADGRYMGMDGKVHRVGKYPQYSNISGWDVYRSQIPLLTLISPSTMDGVVNSMIDDFSQSGWLPRWAYDDVSTNEMGGDSADPIIADAYAFGARGFDATQALSDMVAGATKTGTGPGGYVERPGIQQYLSLGYVPYSSDNGQVASLSGSSTPDGASLTLEYGLDDFSISRLAASLGRTQVTQEFLVRSGAWKHLMDSATGWMAPKLADGQPPAGWPSGSRSLSDALAKLQLGGVGQLGFQEGDQEQYTWLVPQNLAGLFSNLGGRSDVTRRLEKFFTHLNAGPAAPYDWAGNEPNLGTPWEGDYSGAPWLTQQVVYKILKSHYTDTPGGEPGNDDLGAMSSWAVWAMLGLYPETPGTAVLVIGAPTFSSERLDVGGGRAISISTSESAPGAHYISSLRVDGSSSQKTWLPASAVSQGASLDFSLRSRPDKTWGSRPGDAPPSFS